MTAGEKRIAVVTGASRGIGRTTALALARRGYRVFALARAGDELATLREGGLDIMPIPMDIADEDSRNGAVAAIFQATGGYGLDVLINNAGYGQLGAVEEVPAEALRRQLEVNVVGLLALTQPFLPPMRERRQGTVVNVSSAAGRIAAPFMGAYNASKFALEGLSDTLRRELAPFHVRVVLIEPGPIRTDFGRAAERSREGDPSSPYAPYYHRWTRARGASDALEGSPEAVARSIVRAVEAERPRARYTITLQAKAATVARRLMPDSVLDWFFRRAMG